MVNYLAIIFMILSAAVCVLMPIILAIVCYRKYKISIKAVFIGAAVFVVFQLIIRIPLLSLLGSQQWYMDMSSNIYLIALFLGLTAGLFEEVGRYIAMKFFMKKNLSWKNGIAFGIGHGGIEAIALVGITLLNYIIISFMINTGLFDSTIAAQMPPALANQVRSMLVDSPTVNFLAGGFERIMTMSIQIGFSVMVMYSVKFKKPLYLIYAILLHAIVDAPVVVLGTMGLNVWVIELFVMAFAAISLVYIIKAKGLFERQEQKEFENQ